jgi:hypothetical protein
MSTYDISNMITVIGRGHSGTRAISHTLSASGVDMGSPLNDSGDLLPPEPLYDACRIIAPYVRYLGNQQWDFSALHTMPIPDTFVRLVEQYLTVPLASSAQWRGWKLPETTLIYPWIVRMFPNIKYIYWIRDPRDSIMNRHLTDDLSDFGVPYDRTSNIYQMRSISWKYQTAIFHATPMPKHLLTVRFEDFALHQEETLQQIEEFIGIPLQRIPVDHNTVYRWKKLPDSSFLPYCEKEAAFWGYEA